MLCQTGDTPGSEHIDHRDLANQILMRDRITRKRSFAKFWQRSVNQFGWQIRRITRQPDSKEHSESKKERERYQGFEKSRHSPLNGGFSLKPQQLPHSLSVIYRPQSFALQHLPRALHAL